MPLLSTKHLKESHRTLVQFCKHKPIKRVGRLRCHYWAQNIQKQVNRTLVQFCEHKPIGRVGRLMCHYRAQNIWRKVAGLWCNSASTNQLEESGDWRATIKHRTFEGKSQDLGANLRAQTNWKSRETEVQGRTRNIWIWYTRKDKEHWTLILRTASLTHKGSQ